MTSELEERLTRTLSAAAEVAPEADSTFTDGIATRMRRRRRRSTGMVAAAGILALAVPAVPILVLDGGPRQDGTTNARISTGPPVDVTTARPAEQVWPGAVVRLPASLPDGRGYHVARRLPDGRFLIGGYFPPEVLSAATGQSTKLMPDNPSLSYLGGTDVGPTLVVWLMRQGRDNLATAPVEVWAAPLSGGPAVRRAVFDTQQEAAFPVVGFEAGGSIYLTVEQGYSTQRRLMTLRVNPDGSMTRVENADGLQLAVAPWLEPEPASVEVRCATLAATTPQATASPGKAAPCMHLPEPYSPPKFFNVLTGQWRTPVQTADLPEPWCSPEWCLARNGDVVTAYRFDGTGAVSVSNASGDSVLSQGVSLGRFSQLNVGSRRNPVSYLWDLKTNTVGSLGGGPRFASGVMWYDLVFIREDATEIVLLDLSRIP